MLYFNGHTLRDQDNANKSILLVYKQLILGKQRALSLKVACNFRNYLKIGRTSVKTELNAQTIHEQLLLSTHKCIL